MILHVGDSHWDTDTATWTSEGQCNESCPYIKCDGATWDTLWHMCDASDNNCLREFSDILNKAFGLRE